MENSKHEVMIDVDLPEFEEDEIEVSFNRGSMSINARKTAEFEQEAKDFYQDRKIKKTFTYKTTLPKNVITEYAKTDFKNGHLKIHIPKKD